MKLSPEIQAELKKALVAEACEHALKVVRHIPANYYTDSSRGWASHDLGNK